MIDQLLADSSQLIAVWYQWGVAIAFAVGFVTTMWIFYDSNASQVHATAWRMLSLLAALGIVPSAVLSFFPDIVPGLSSIPFYLAVIGMVATLLSVLCLVLYSLRIGVSPLGDDVPEDLDVDLLAEDAVDPALVPTPLKGQPLQGSKITTSRQNALPAQPATIPPDETIMLPPEKLPPLAWLVLMNGPRSGHEYRLGDLMDVGRGSKHNNISLEDPAVSRQHARIRREKDGFVLYDLASVNGIIVNDEQTQRHVLRHGDHIQIGQTIFGMLLVGEDSVPAAVSDDLESDALEEAHQEA